MIIYHHRSAYNACRVLYHRHAIPAESVELVMLYIAENQAQHGDLEDLVTLNFTLQYQTLEVFRQVIAFYCNKFLKNFLNPRSGVNISSTLHVIPLIDWVSIN